MKKSVYVYKNTYNCAKIYDKNILHTCKFFKKYINKYFEYLTYLKIDLAVILITKEREAST